ncbi:MAG: hypothetical protein PHC52_13415 [Syntrophales bacterium]|nr:hypothetical protein [Syntrophales bacterium]
MTIEAALYTYLSTYAGLIALTNDRIYPGQIPEKRDMPAVSVFLIDDPPIHAGGADATVYQPRFQFTCWGSSYKNACDVATQVKAALRDYSGTMGGEGGVVVQRSFYEGATDIYNEEREREARALDFIIWHE